MWSKSILGRGCARATPLGGLAYLRDEGPESIEPSEQEGQK